MSGNIFEVCFGAVVERTKDGRLLVVSILRAIALDLMHSIHPYLSCSTNPNPVLAVVVVAISGRRE